jgi:hypothetical protein
MPSLYEAIFFLTKGQPIWYIIRIGEFVSLLLWKALTRKPVGWAGSLAHADPAWANKPALSKAEWVAHPMPEPLRLRFEKK